jgi:hypothetical protein
VKAPDWDDRLLSAHRNFIGVEEVRRAFDYLSAAALRAHLYIAQNSGIAGQKKSVHYNEPHTAERPFAFIINRGHLLFYVRRYIQKRFPDGIASFKRSFAVVSENRSGEWKIRIETLEDAKRIQAMALDSESSKVGSSTFDSREEADDIAARVIEERGDIGPVEKDQLIKARRGQGHFREELESSELGCRLTRITDRGHLRASHIKPWSKSNDREKLDPNNGLLLSPHIDHLFDRGYISFADNGDLMRSNRLDPSILAAWGVQSPPNCGNFNAPQCVYPDYHRKHVFLK